MSDRLQGGLDSVEGRSSGCRRASRLGDLDSVGDGGRCRGDRLCCCRHRVADWQGVATTDLTASTAGSTGGARASATGAAIASKPEKVARPGLRPRSSLLDGGCDLRRLQSGRDRCAVRRPCRWRRDADATSECPTQVSRPAAPACETIRTKARPRPNSNPSSTFHGRRSAVPIGVRRSGTVDGKYPLWPRSKPRDTVQRPPASSAGPSTCTSRRRRRGRRSTSSVASVSAHPSRPTDTGRLAQLVRAPPLQGGGRGFESRSAHQQVP